MNKKTARKSTRVGVVGYGGAFNMGRIHLNEMKTAGMTPVAVAEVDSARALIALEDFPGIKIFTSVDEMLAKSDVELVTLITPHDTHAPLGLQCLKAGRHVICEKPMAVTTAECDAMIAAAKKKKLLLSTYHNRHWDGWILRAVDEVKKKKIIGDVFRIDLRMGKRSKPGDWWRSSRSISGGILYDWGVHLLEYALQLIDSDVTEVSGFAHEGFWGAETKWKKDTIEDEGAAVVRFKGGEWVNLSISHLDANQKPGFMEIHGTRGNYVIDWNGYTVHHIDDGVVKTEHGAHPHSQGQKFYDNVAAHLAKGQKLVITPEWARRPIHILDLAVQSAKAGKTLRAKYR